MCLCFSAHIPLLECRLRLKTYKEVPLTERLFSHIVLSTMMLKKALAQLTQSHNCQVCDVWRLTKLRQCQQDIETILLKASSGSGSAIRLFEINSKTTICSLSRNSCVFHSWLPNRDHRFNASPAVCSIEISPFALSCHQHRAPCAKLEVEIRVDIIVVVLTQQQAKKDSRTPISTLRMREVGFFPLPHCVGEMTPLLFGLQQTVCRRERENLLNAFWQRP